MRGGGGGGGGDPSAPAMFLFEMHVYLTALAPIYTYDVSTCMYLVMYVPRGGLTSDWARAHVC